MLDKKSDLVAYTISSKDKRGNGVYIYNLKTYITQALETGNFNYSNLSWNKDRTAIAALKYDDAKKEKDPVDIRIITVMGVNSDHVKTFEYNSEDISGLPENMRLAVKNEKGSNKITWSNDNERLFLSIKKKIPKAPEKNKSPDDSLMDEATTDVWHWKDKKLVSQQMLEAKKEKNKAFRIVFNCNSKKAIQLTGDEIQRIFRRPDTDTWAIGTDDRAYISDWDVPKNDFYRINLLTGERKLIIKEQIGSMNISPDREKAIFWRDGHYWYYNFKNHSRENITANVAVSFLNREHDLYGSSPAYGFVGWVKDHDSVIVNHKLDLWQLPLDGKSKAVNLTESITLKDSIRFRFDDMSFIKKPEMEERYIDLSTPIIISAFNIKTKYSGYYQLSKNELKKLIYKPAFFTNSRWWRWRSGLIKAKKSTAIIFRQSSYEKYPEAFLSTTDFSKPKKLTTTNPQQSKYKWGHRVLIDYTNDDGVPLQGILSIPDGYKKGQRLPMIVFSYEKLSEGLFRYPNFRISGHSVGEMMYVSDGYLFLKPDIHFNIGTPHSDMHECIDAAIGKVLELGYVDEKRIGYQGFSFGGHCGMFISTQKNRFAAIAAGAGVSNLVQGFNIDIVYDGSNEQDYYMTQQGRLGADPTAKPEMYIRESAVFNAKNMDTPLLLFHGTADKVVQWEHSFDLYSILRFLKKPVIFLSYRGEGHGLRQKANRLDIQKRLKEYFDHYLKGKEAPEWIVNGLPYREPVPVKKKTKQKEQRTVPAWKKYIKKELR
ncbi:alpha/beta hydrolase family protein [Acidobacteriota bacterium]